MTTLLLPPRHTDDSRLIWRAAVAAGWSTLRLPAWHVPSDIETRDLAFYGEPLLAAHVAEVLRLKLIEPRLDWLVTLPQDYVRRKVYASTLGQARQLSHRAFIKPADDKAFRAAVYESGRHLDASHLYHESLMVLISEPVEFRLEYRFFVLDRGAETYSLYARNGELVEFAEGYEPDNDPYGQHALAFAKSVLSDESVYFPPAVVFDIGLLADGEWAVIECNPCWGSGIYGCDPTCILSVLKRACVPFELTAGYDPQAFVDRAQSG